MTEEAAMIAIWHTYNKHHYANDDLIITRTDNCRTHSRNVFAQVRFRFRPLNWDFGLRSPNSFPRFRLPFPSKDVALRCHIGIAGLLCGPRPPTT